MRLFGKRWFPVEEDPEIDPLPEETMFPEEDPPPSRWLSIEAVVDPFNGLFD